MSTAQPAQDPRAAEYYRQQAVLREQAQQQQAAPETRVTSQPETTPVTRAETPSVQPAQPTQIAPAQHPVEQSPVVMQDILPAQEPTPVMDALSEAAEPAQFQPEKAGDFLEARIEGGGNNPQAAEQAFSDTIEQVGAHRRQQDNRIIN